MREIGPFVDSEHDGPYSLFWAVEGRGRKSVTLDLRTPEGQDLFRRLAATADVRRRELPARHARAVEHRARTTSTRRLVTVRISMFGQDGPYSPRPGPRPRRHRLRRAAAPHRLPRPAAGARRRHDLRLPHRRVRRAGRRRARCTRATRAAAGGAVIDAALYGAVLRILEWTLAAYDRLGIVRHREGNRLANSAPLDNYPTARRQVRVHRRRLRRQLRAPVQGDGPARPARRSPLHASSPIGPRTATRSTASSPSGPRRSTRATIEERCVAHDVPVATAYTAADIFADPHFDAARRSRDRRRPGDRSGPPAGAVSAPRRRDPGRAAGGRAAPRRAHRRGAARAARAPRRRARPRCRRRA